MTIEELLNGKGVFMTFSALARLWRMIFREVNMSESKWNHMVDRYYLDLTKDMDSRAAANLKVNHITAFLSQDLTWANLVKALHLLGHSEVCLEFTARRSEEDSHSEKLYLNTKDNCKANKTQFSVKSIGEDISKINYVWANLKQKLTAEKSWECYLNEYAEKVQKEALIKDPKSKIKTGSLKTSIKKKLKLTNSSISWNAFQQGIAICGAKELVINLKLKTVKTLEIELVIFITKGGLKGVN